MTAMLRLRCAVAHWLIASRWLYVCRPLPRRQLIIPVQLSCSIVRLGYISMNRSMQNFRSLLNGNIFTCSATCLILCHLYLSAHYWLHISVSNFSSAVQIVFFSFWIEHWAIIQLSLLSFYNCFQTMLTISVMSCCFSLCCNKVTLHQASLVPRWVTIRGYTVLV